MAITTVVNDRFFERLLPVLTELDRDPATGPLSFAMLIQSTVDDNYRSLVLSSAALDRLGWARATDVVLETMRERLGKERFRIDNYSVLSTTDRAIEEMSQAYDIPQLGTAYMALGSPASSFDLDRPILFLSRPLTAAAA